MNQEQLNQTLFTKNPVWLVEGTTLSQGILQFKVKGAYWFTRSEDSVSFPVPASSLYSTYEEAKEALIRELNKQICLLSQSVLALMKD